MGMVDTMDTGGRVKFCGALGALICPSGICLFGAILSHSSTLMSSLENEGVRE